VKGLLGDPFPSARDRDGAATIPKEPGIAVGIKKETVPQPLRASLSLRNAWLLPGSGDMTYCFWAGFGEQRRGRGQRKLAWNRRNW
jgi:hypothetical protein